MDLRAFVSGLNHESFSALLTACTDRLREDIDTIEARPVAGVVPYAKELTSAELWCLRNGSRIPAIKSYRERTGTGLREAKEFVDNYKYDSLG